MGVMVNVFNNNQRMRNQVLTILTLSTQILNDFVLIWFVILEVIILQVSPSELLIIEKCVYPTKAA